MSIRNRFLRACLIVAALTGLIGATSCASYTTAHTASPIEQGTAETWSSVGYYGISASVDGGAGALRGSLPNFEAGGRFGISETVDIGGKIFPIGAGVDVNIAPVNTSNFAFSINPAFSIVALPSSNATGGGSYGTALVNLLADVVKTETFTLTTGLKPGMVYGFGTARGTFNGAARFAMGGTLGSKIRVNEKLAFTPWVDVLAPVGIKGGSLIFYTAMVGVNYKLGG